MPWHPTKLVEAVKSAVLAHVNRIGKRQVTVAPFFWDFQLLWIVQQAKTLKWRLFC
jgi:hypothetical protein